MNVHLFISLEVQKMSGKSMEYGKNFVVCSSLLMTVKRKTFLDSEIVGGN